MADDDSQEKERGMMVYLYNLRARMVGINQIKNFFQPALDRDASNVM